MHDWVGAGGGSGSVHDDDKDSNAQPWHRWQCDSHRPLRSPKQRGLKWIRRNFVGIVSSWPRFDVVVSTVGSTYQFMMGCTAIITEQSFAVRETRYSFTWPKCKQFWLLLSSYVGEKLQVAARWKNQRTVGYLLQGILHRVFVQWLHWYPTTVVMVRTIYIVLQSGTYVWWKSTPKFLFYLFFFFAFFDTSEQTDSPLVLFGPWRAWVVIFKQTCTSGNESKVFSREMYKSNQITGTCLLGDLENGCALFGKGDKVLRCPESPVSGSSTLYPTRNPLGFSIPKVQLEIWTWTPVVLHDHLWMDNSGETLCKGWR